MKDSKVRKSLLNGRNRSCYRKFASHDDDIYVFTNLTGVGNMEVNAFQRGADITLQKSLKEGFGLMRDELRLIKELMAL